MTWPKVKVIALSMCGVPAYVAEMLKGGACGYLLKDGPMADLVTAGRAIAQGQTCLNPTLEPGHAAVRRVQDGIVAEGTRESYGWQRQGRRSCRWWMGKPSASWRLPRLG